MTFSPIQIHMEKIRRKIGLRQANRGKETLFPKKKVSEWDILFS